MLSKALPPLRWLIPLLLIGFAPGCTPAELELELPALRGETITYRLNGDSERLLNALSPDGRTLTQLDRSNGWLQLTRYHATEAYRLELSAAAEQFREAVKGDLDNLVGRTFPLTANLIGQWPAVNAHCPVCAGPDNRDTSPNDKFAGFTGSLTLTSWSSEDNRLAGTFIATADQDPNIELTNGRFDLILTLR